jgi:hypothetical protein
LVPFVFFAYSEYVAVSESSYCRSIRRPLPARAKKIQVSLNPGAWGVERSLVLAKLGHSFLQPRMGLYRRRFTASRHRKLHGQSSSSQFQRLRARPPRGHPLFSQSSRLGGDEPRRAHGAQGIGGKRTCRSYSGIAIAPRQSHSAPITPAAPFVAQIQVTPFPPQADSN